MVMKIAVIGGGGAMGGLFGGHLARAGEDVTLVDVSREAVAAINAGGLQLQDAAGNTETIRVRATSDPAEVGAVDLALVFVKCYHTEAAVRGAAPLLGPETAVLSLQNGWGNAPRIAAIAGAERVLAGVTYHSATVLGPGRIHHTGRGITWLGELDGGRTDRLGKIAGALRRTGFEVASTENVLGAIWAKLALNVCTLPTSALLRFTADQLVEHDGTLSLMRGLLHEAVAVANAQGAALDEAERWEAITGLLARAKGGKSSMLQDVERQRRTEIDVVNGAVVEGGRRLGIATPCNGTMVWLIRSLEETFPA
jgi:2-dehydropantoate 2-reductase